MATYVDSSMLEQQASSEEIHDMMLKKAHDLFALCDKENKGFITKRDMQRLQTELPLSPEQLEDVFDSLDDDANGYLTREEFTDGFGGFIGMGPSSLEKQMSVESSGSTGTEHVYEEGGDDEGGEEHFQQMMDTIGVHTVIDDSDTLKSLWSRLRCDDPDLLGPFEQFLSRVTSELKRTHHEHQSLETALKSKTSAHEEEVKKLYEEMEQQIKVEKDRVMAEERSKELQLREELEMAIHEKDSQLNELIATHGEIGMKLQNLNSQEFETKQENEKLLKERNDLEDVLNHSQRNLDDSRAYISELRQQYRKEKKERAMAAMQISEGIALERESLVKQLDMLRDMNKKLRDDHDEAELRRQGSSLQQEISEAMLNGELKSALDQNENKSSQNEQIEQRRKEQPDGAPVTEEGVARQQSMGRNSRNQSGAKLEKQGSLMSNYFSPEPHRDGTMNALDSDDDIECDDPIMMTNHSAAGSVLANGHAAGMTPANEYNQSQREYLDGMEREADPTSANHREALTSLAAQSGEAITNTSHDMLLDNRLSQREYPSTSSHNSSERSEASPESSTCGLQPQSVSGSRSLEVSISHGESVPPRLSRSSKESRSPEGSRSPTDSGLEDSRSPIGSRSPEGSISSEGSRSLDRSRSTANSRSHVGSSSPTESRSAVGSRSSRESRLTGETNSMVMSKLPEASESLATSRATADSRSIEGSMSPAGTCSPTGSRSPPISRSPERSSLSARSNLAEQYRSGSRSPAISRSPERSSLPARSDLAEQYRSGSRSPSDDKEMFDGTRPKSRHHASAYSDSMGHADRDRTEFDIQSPRGVPVGANSSTEKTEYDRTQKEIEAASPERLFKVVFVGDSGVGKSSFIHQFCSRSFKPTFSATIGVDFQVKNMKVDGHIIALQLWDTAGQERFRSITKQYFRKADGVLVMYDVTSELSYKNIRNWMTSVQEGTSDNTVIAIAGNKIDLVEEEEGRVVTTKDGSKLADEYGALFYEVSAKTGVSVVQTLEGMASLLREREDEEIEKALNLTDNGDGKKKCCG